MPDNNEIQAAAARLLKEKHYNYWECNQSVNAMTDSKLLADAYLAEHPTDGSELSKQLVDDLAMIVRRLCHRLDKLHPGLAMVAQANDYLRRKGLQGSILRSTE